MWERHDHLPWVRLQLTLKRLLLVGKKVQDEVYVFMKFEVSNKVAMEKRAKDRSDK